MRNADTPITPVFAGGSSNNGNTFTQTTTEWAHLGLTKREFFAAAAMQGVCANPDWDWGSKPTAKVAVMCADALLAELEKEVSV